MYNFDMELLVHCLALINYGLRFFMHLGYRPWFYITTQGAAFEYNGCECCLSVVVWCVYKVVVSC